MKIVLVGSNPSNSSETDTAFCKSTRSRRFIDSWFYGLDVHLEFDNVSHERTPNNRPLKMSEIRSAIPDLQRRLSRYNIVVALGKTAAKALDIAHIEHVEMPHPSGRNRFWNDPLNAARAIEEVRRYVNDRREKDSRVS